MSILTISIITRNRSQFLRKGLFEMFEGIKENNLILNIFDNSSKNDKETYKIYEELKKQYEKVFYYGTNKELNYPENCKRAFEKYSDSEYLLVIGDSSYIPAKNLKNILEILKLRKYDVLVLNNERVKDIKEDKEYRDKQEFFEEMTWHCTLIGSTIYKQEFLKLNMIKGIYEKYTGNDFFQLGILLEGINYKENIEVLFIKKKNLFSVKIPKESYWRKNTFKIFGEDWIKFIEILPKDFQNKDKVIKLHGVKSGLFTLKEFIFLREKNCFNLDILKKNKELILKLSEIKIFYLYLIAVAPKILIRKLRDTIKIKRR